MANKYNEKKEYVEVPKYGNDVGIRATLNNFGITNDKIGYNEKSGNVTINGLNFMKPSYLDEDAGVSYASEKDIRNSLTDFYKKSNNPIVRVSDAYQNAAGKYGLDADALSYHNGTVYIAGNPLNTLFTDDKGKAWAWANDVNDAVESYAKSLNVENNNELEKMYENKYLKTAQDKADDILFRDDFEYNPDDDPVYNAYRNKYIREGNRATEDYMAKYSALTGGYENSAAITAGAMASQYYANQLTDKIPELAEQAYKRYYDKYMLDIDAINSSIDMYDTAYKNALTANGKSIDNANYTVKGVIDRDENVKDRAWKEKQNKQAYDKAERDEYWKEIEEEQEQIERALKNKGYSLDDAEKEIYLEYYRRLIETELEGADLKNKKTVAETYSIYNR